MFLLLGRYTRVVGFIIGINAIVSLASYNANQAYGAYGATDALITVGIATGIGAVLGLSTISFYQAPFDHLGNVLIGAGAGLIAGVGVAGYLIATAPAEDEEFDPEELIVPKKIPPKDEKSGDKKEEKKKADQGRFEKKIKYRGFSPRPAYALNHSTMATLAFPDTRTNNIEDIALQSNVPQWKIGLRVLELRF